MPIAVSAQQAYAQRRGNTFKDVIAQPFYSRLYMGSEPRGVGVVDPDKMSMAQAYLVEQPADSTVAPHFHDTNQFQVVVHGTGAFGKQALSGLLVHYAGAHTPYRPIVAAEQGVHYFTLRNNWDSGAKIMPENRAKLRKVKRVHRMATNVDVPSVQTLKGVALDLTDIVPVEADGLGVRRFDVGPGRTCEVGFDVAGAGAYMLVLAGSIAYAQVVYETHSLIHTAADEAPPTVVAGADGARVLLLQYPPEPAA
jgi:hypothetical protein